VFNFSLVVRKVSLIAISPNVRRLLIKVIKVVKVVNIVKYTAAVFSQML